MAATCVDVSESGCDVNNPWRDASKLIDQPLSVHLDEDASRIVVPAHNYQLLSRTEVATKLPALFSCAGMWVFRLGSL